MGSIFKIYVENVFSGFNKTLPSRTGMDSVVKVSKRQTNRTISFYILPLALHLIPLYYLTIFLTYPAKSKVLSIFIISISVVSIFNEKNKYMVHANYKLKNLGCRWTLLHLNLFIYFKVYYKFVLLIFYYPYKLFYLPSIINIQPVIHL